MTEPGVASAPLRHVASIPLPPHRGAGGFDHAAYVAREDRLYLAHTANDAVEIIDCATRRHLTSLDGHRQVAGVVVDPERGFVATSDRGAAAVGLRRSVRGADRRHVSVPARPNGMAVDPTSGLLLVATVGDPDNGAPPEVALVDPAGERVLDHQPAPGRTRWVVYDRRTDAFFVNIASPPSILVIEPRMPLRVRTTIAIPFAGPHGLDLDPTSGLLFCACDAGALVGVDAESGSIAGSAPLTGTPDVLFVDDRRRRAYVAIGDPGCIDVIDIDRFKRIGSMTTSPGTHSFGFDDVRGEIYALQPLTHSAEVFADGSAG